jgi:hypothetical protein
VPLQQLIGKGQQLIALMVEVKPLIDSIEYSVSQVLLKLG